MPSAKPLSDGTLQVFFSASRLILPAFLIACSCVCSGKNNENRLKHWGGVGAGLQTCLLILPNGIEIKTFFAQAESVLITIKISITSLQGLSPTGAPVFLCFFFDFFCPGNRGEKCARV